MHPRILLAVLAAFFAAVAGAVDNEFIHLMNIGKAYLENRESEKAIESFTAAIQRAPRSCSALRNLFRAYLLDQKPDAALGLLARLTEIEPESAANSYLAGIAEIRRSQFDRAVPHLEQAVRIDPNTAALRFQLAIAYQALDRTEDAEQQLRETVRLDPLHSSAHYRLAAIARVKGNMDEFRERQLEFARLRKIFGDETRSNDALERCAYTDPEAAVAESLFPSAPQAISVRFVDATKDWQPEPRLSPVAADVLFVDDHGDCTLFLVHADGACFAWKTGREKSEPRLVEIAGGVPLAAVECRVANYHDEVPPGTRYDPTKHAHNDVLLIGSDRLRLLRQNADGTFSDQTHAAKLEGLTALDALWVDYDHDGDLDLLLARESGAELRQNNGDGSFVNVTADVGFPLNVSAIGASAADLDRNLGIDIVLARGGNPSFVLENQRAGRFRERPDPPGPWPPASLVLLDDIDRDGRHDAVLIGESIAIVIRAADPSRRTVEPNIGVLRTGAFIDYENNGWLDLVFAGDRGLRVWRNGGDGRWTDASADLGFDPVSLVGIRRLLAFDFDNDGDTDLVGVGGEPALQFLRNDGGNVNAQLKLRLIGLKANPIGFGTHVEIRKDSFQVTRNVMSLPLEIGLGDHRSLDSLQTLWASGVIDNQIGIEIGAAPVTIAERNVATGSCPFLYAWDGARFRFINDFLGNSPLGLPLSRDILLDADPDELVIIGPEGTLASREGAFELELTSEFREVLYLDTAALLVVDHPPDVEIHSPDKLMPAPFPPSELWSLHRRVAPRTARGDDGVDRTEALQEIDGNFAPAGNLAPPPFRGQYDPLAIDLEFEQIDSAAPLVLALTGWIQYGQASTNIALSQGAARPVIPPMLEAQTPSGWHPVDVVVGMPAGKTKTIIVDLTGKLPPRTQRLRLTTTFEIRWDRIALFERDTRPVMVQTLTPLSADLRFRGFSDIRSREMNHPMTPDYETVSDRPPWRGLVSGWCTRYGDVLELVHDRDNRLALLNAGDALRLRFAADALSPKPAGLQRTYVFFSVGWDKDADYNCVDGDRVEPLPVPGPDEEDQLDWRIEYNTRFVPRDRFEK